MVDYTYCPACFEGKLYEVCEDCAGSGEALTTVGQCWDDPNGQPEVVICETCHGSGEKEVSVCRLCGGTSRITQALGRLYEAEQWVLRNHLDWSGDDAEHPGVTVYSLAKWYRLRSMFTGAVFTAIGYPKDFTVMFTVPKNYEVTFHGFSWGYGGTGPTGLAVVLADAFPLRFFTLEEAKKFVAELDQEKGWSI